MICHCLFLPLVVDFAIKKQQGPSIRTGPMLYKPKLFFQVRMYDPA